MKKYTYLRRWLVVSGIFMVLALPTHAQQTSKEDMLEIIERLTLLIIELQQRQLTSNPYSGPEETIIRTTDTVNVRIAPGLGAKTAATIPAGIEGTILSGPISQNGYEWYNIKYMNGTSGYTASPWITFSRKNLNYKDTLYTFKSVADGEIRAGEEEQIAYVSLPSDSWSRERYLNDANIAFVGDTNNKPWESFASMRFRVLGGHNRTYTVDLSDPSSWTPVFFKELKKTGHILNLFNVSKHRGYGAMFGFSDLSLQIGVSLQTKRYSGIEEKWIVFVPAKGVSIWDGNKGTVEFGGNKESVSFSVVKE